ncbi:MAG: HNH endonuclease [Acidimicrobiia bacterium]|nr:HNH endonuclease [Acidimicrobiia bacterium]
MFSNGTTTTAHTSPLDLVTSALEIAIDLDYASGDGVAETVTRVSEIVDRLQLKLTELVAEADRKGVHRTDGYTSMTALLAHKARMRAGRAKRTVADGRALREMPETTRRLQSGRLSYDEARPLIAAREAHPEQFADHEAGLCDAVETTGWVRDAHKVIDYWRQAVSEPADDRRRYEDRAFHGSFTLDGMFDFSGRMPADMGRAFMDEIESAVPPPSPDDDRSPGQRRLDGLFDAVVSDGDRPIKPAVTVHVAAGRLTNGARGIGEIADHVLTDGVIHRLTCDAAITRIVMSPDSQPLDIGRSTRTVPEPMRRAVIARDRHCRFPGCRRPTRWCDAHHIVHWADGGATSVDNLILLCRHHHTLVHTEFGLSGSGQDPKFTRPNGTHLPNSPPLRI